MRITLNGAPADISAATLATALDELGYRGSHIATAVNETFVPAAARAATALSDGDRIEVLAPMQGG